MVIRDSGLVRAISASTLALIINSPGELRREGSIVDRTWESSLSIAGRIVAHADESDSIFDSPVFE